MRFKLSIDALLHRDGYDLISAAKNNDVATVNTLLAANPTLIFFSRHFSGQSAWHLAAVNGSAEVITELAQFVQQHSEKLARFHLARATCFGGSDPAATGEETARKAINQENHQQQTALMLAAAASKPECARLLLEAGADLNMRDSGLRTALHYAGFSGCTATASVLISAVEHLSLSQPRPTAYVSRFIDRRSLCGFTALHYAVYHGNVETCQQLLFAGASPLARCTWAGSLEGIWCEPGTTALHLAARSGSMEIAKLILQAMITRTGSLIWLPSQDPRQLRDRHGKTPYHMAVQLNRTRLAHLLHPSTPLTELFSEDELSSLMVEAFPTLSMLAASSHRALLRTQLRAICPSQLSELQDGKGDAGLPGAEASSSQPPPATLSMRARRAIISRLSGHGKKASAAQLALDALELEQRDSADMDTACGVCYSQQPNVSMETCGHTLCGDCCSRICETDGIKVPLCPFCRQEIRALAAMAEITAETTAETPPVLVTEIPPPTAS